jgi:hypothetical protein
VKPNDGLLSNVSSENDTPSSLSNEERVTSINDANIKGVLTKPLITTSKNRANYPTPVLMISCLVTCKVLALI